MRRLAATLGLLALLSGCSKDDPSASPTPAPRTPISLPSGAVDSIVLTSSDVGDGWDAEKDAAPSTLQIGGTVGPANVKGAEQQATSAFKKQGSSAYITNSVFVMESAQVAEQLMLAHEQATVEKWTQERMDGGGASFRRIGKLAALEPLGDEMFTATVSSTIRDAKGAETKRAIAYVVYRIDRLLGFVIAQDTGVATLARRQEEKVERLLT